MQLEQTLAEGVDELGVLDARGAEGSLVRLERLTDQEDRLGVFVVQLRP